MESALKLLKKGGTFGYFSGLTGDASISAATLNLIHYKELRIVGSYGCALQPHTGSAVRLLAGGAFDGIPTETIFPTNWKRI
jgi:L-iditol 2-dehydrogenase